MKKLPRLVYAILMAALVFVLVASGCGSDNNNSSSSTTTTVSGRKIVAVSSPVFSKGGSYKLYKGGSFRFASGDPKYYVAPVAAGSEMISLNLEFSQLFSDDSFVIVRSEDDKVVFGYDRDGADSPDLTTALGTVIRWGGRQQKYTGLNVTGAAIDIETDDVITISLDASTSTATLSGASTGEVPSSNFVWHISPDHAGEYWTLANTEYDDEEMYAAVQSNDGVYIARDIRYTPNTLNFVTTQTASKDEDDPEYVVYYDSSADQVASKIRSITTKSGDAYAGPYILASLPMRLAGENAMPGGEGGFSGNPPDSQDMTPPSSQNGGNPPSSQGGSQTETPRMSAFTAAADSSIAAYSTMTHSAEQAYNNPVLHITRPGTYRLKGTWHGQIWIDDLTASDPETNSGSQVALILDGVEVSCDVAPALVFHDLYECGPTSNIVSFDVKNTLNSTTSTNAGAIVILANGSVNNFTGSNVYRIMKLKPKNSASKVNGTDISDQKKMYKMDGAFYSFVSMVIGTETGTGTGRLNVTSTTFEGLDAEMHMLIDSGTVTVTAPDDGINVNEDDTSVFTMDNGTLTINSSGGDGIDSNGWVVVNGGTLNISAGDQQYNANGEAGIDAEKGYYVSPNATFNWRSAGNTFDTGTGTQTQTGQETSNGTISDDVTSDDTSGLMQPITLYNASGNLVLNISFTPVSSDNENNRPNNFPSTSTIFTLYNKVNNFSGIQNN